MEVEQSPRSNSAFCCRQGHTTQPETNLLQNVLLQLRDSSDSPDSQSSDAQSLDATVQGTLRANSSHTEGTNQPTPLKFPQIPTNSLKFPQISPNFPQIPSNSHPEPLFLSQPSLLSERACPIAAKMAKSLNSSRNYSSAPIYPAMEEYGAGLSCPMGICL